MLLSEALSCMYQSLGKALRETELELFTCQPSLSKFVVLGFLHRSASSWFVLSVPVMCYSESSGVFLLSVQSSDLSGEEEEQASFVTQ